MTTKDELVRTPDGHDLFCYQWLPDAGTVLKGSVLVLHGMADHAARFFRLGSALCAAGYAVYAHDQRGHGRTAGSTNKIGIIADSDGLDVLVEDAHLIVKKLKSDFPGLPVFLFAHSMGSFVAQGYAQKYGNGIAGMVLSGSNGSIGIMADLARIIAKGEVRKHGRDERSEKLNA
ncbi:MAG TPA: alpha/beta fold hydrolase, partial [Treponemataceae bacterium]|nr:alpha/beta fold hydrolase [Treponemataceae bacterium]